MISDISTNRLAEEAQEYFNKRMWRDPKRKPDWKHKGADVYQFGDGTDVAYIFLVEKDEVTYFVKYRKISHNGFRLGRQVLVLRIKMTAATGGFAQYVFFNVLLPKYGALIADQQQTEFGRNFWANAIVRAFAQKFHVYFLDRRSTPNALHEIKNDSDLDHYAPQIWGESRGHERTFAVISQTKLHLISRKSKKK